MVTSFVNRLENGNGCTAVRGVLPRVRPFNDRATKRLAAFKKFLRDPHLAQPDAERCVRPRVGSRRSY